MRPASRPTRRPAAALSHLHCACRPGTLLVAIAITLLGCTAQPPEGSPNPSGRLSPTAGSTTPPALRSPAPTSPAAAPLAGLVVRSWTCLTCIYSMGTMVFDDGLVLTDGRGDGVIRARHLSPEGLAWVKTRLAESPLAVGQASYGAVPAPGAPPDQRDHTVHRFVLERDGVVARVDSDVVAELLGGPEAWVIPDEMLALEQLSADLASVDAWVPRDLWTDTWAPYRPERFLLQVDFWRDTSPGDFPPAPDVDEVPWPLAGGIDRVGTTRPGGDPQGERCVVIGEQWAERLVAAEAFRGVQRSLDEPYVSNVYGWKRGNGALVVATRWLLPHEPSDCNKANSDW